MNPRSEPLLWVQLLGLAALPGELLLAFLLLAGGDPGPVPGLERLFCWALGALLPAVLFWRQPPDVWSLLLVQIPMRGRRDLQRRLSGLQAPLAVKLLAAAGALLLLPLIWLIDDRAGLAAAFSPIGSSTRLLGLVLCVPVLAICLWQWNQFWQALWLLSRPAGALEAAAEAAGRSDEPVAERLSLSLGLPLLLPDPLRLASGLADQPGEEAIRSAVSPEQQSEEQQGPALDEQIS